MTRKGPGKYVGETPPQIMFFQKLFPIGFPQTGSRAGATGKASAFGGFRTPPVWRKLVCPPWCHNRTKQVAPA